MDIKNILNKDGAASKQKAGSDSESEKSSPGSASPKSTASAPPLSAPEVSTTNTPVRRVQPPPTAPRRGSFVPPPTPTTRDFVCLTCQKTFARRSDLVRHGAFSCSYRFSNHLQKEYILDYGALCDGVF
jgi:hypothetical protein